MKHKIAVLVILAATSAALAQQGSPAGTWRVEDGSGNVRIARCGNAYCGFAGDGKQVFQQMRKTGANAWTGVIRDVRDNSSYDGTISLVDARTLRVHGCLSGGGMCGDETWTRVR